MAPSNAHRGVRDRSVRTGWRENPSWTWRRRCKEARAWLATLDASAVHRSRPAGHCLLHSATLLARMAPWRHICRAPRRGPRGARSASRTGNADTLGMFSHTVVPVRTWYRYAPGPLGPRDVAAAGATRDAGARTHEFGRAFRARQRARGYVACTSVARVSRPRCISAIDNLRRLTAERLRSLAGSAASSAASGSEGRTHTTEGPLSCAMELRKSVISPPSSAHGGAQSPPLRNGQPFGFESRRRRKVVTRETCDTSACMRAAVGSELGTRRRNKSSTPTSPSERLRGRSHSVATRSPTSDTMQLRPVFAVLLCLSGLCVVREPACPACSACDRCLGARAGADRPNLPHGEPVSVQRLGGRDGHPGRQPRRRAAVLECASAPAPPHAPRGRSASGRAHPCNCHVAAAQNDGLLAPGEAQNLVIPSENWQSARIWGRTECNWTKA
jgi:hypothetical protein